MAFNCMNSYSKKALLLFIFIQPSVMTTENDSGASMSSIPL